MWMNEQKIVSESNNDNFCASCYDQTHEKCQEEIVKKTCEVMYGYNASYEWAIL